MIRISLSNRQAPTELRLFRKGENQTRKGTFVFDDAAAKAVMLAYAEHNAKVAFDYDHGSTQQLVVDPKESGKAAGRCDLELRDGELWAVNIKWTPAAKAAIEAEEWMYVSPTFKARESRIEQIIAIALTNIPATDGPMPLIELSEEIPSEAPVELAEWTTEYINDLPDAAFLWIAPGGEIDDMGKTVPRDSRKLPVYDAEGKLDLPHLRNALARLESTEGPSDEEKASIKERAQKLLDEASEEKAEEPEAEVEAMAESAKEEPVAEAGEPVEAACKPEKLSQAEPTSAIVALTGADSEAAALSIVASWRESHEQLSQVRVELAASKQAFDELERAVLLKDNASKIPGKLADWAKSQSTEALKQFFASAPEVVPTKFASQPQVEKVVQLSDEERFIAKRFGIPEEKALAYKQRTI